MFSSTIVLFCYRFRFRFVLSSSSSSELCTGKIDHLLGPTTFGNVEWDLCVILRGKGASLEFLSSLWLFLVMMLQVMLLAAAAAMFPRRAWQVARPGDAATLALLAYFLLFFRLSPRD